MEVRDPVTGETKKEFVTTKRVLKYVKPDTTAQIFWLKNRRPDVWRDKQHIEHSGGVGITDLSYLSDEELEKELEAIQEDE